MRSRAEILRVPLLTAVGLLLLVALMALLSFPKGRRIVVNAQGNYVGVKVADHSDLLLYLPGGGIPAADGGGLIAVAGEYVLGPGSTLEFALDQQRREVQLTVLEGQAPPVIRSSAGEITVPYGVPLVLDSATLRRIGTVRARGVVTLGAQPASNSLRINHSGRWAFVEWMVGVGEVTTLAGEIGRFDRLQPVRLADRMPLPVELLIDLSDIRAGLGLHLEVLDSARGAGRSGLLIGRQLSAEIVPTAPDWLDRAMANPLGQYLVVLLLGLVMFVTQLLALFMPRRGAAEQQESWRRKPRWLGEGYRSRKRRRSTREG